MTPEQASKLRKGDRILVEIVVFDDAVIEGRVSVFVPGTKSCTFVRTTDIREVLPRPLEAGDRVIPVGKTLNPPGGKILAVDDHYAWVKWPDDSRGTWPLSDLQRVEDQ